MRISVATVTDLRDLSMVSGDSYTALMVHPDIDLIDRGILTHHGPLEYMTPDGQVISNCTKDFEWGPVIRSWNEMPLSLSFTWDFTSHSPTPLMLYAGLFSPFFPLLFCLDCTSWIRYKGSQYTNTQDFTTTCCFLAVI